jgi:hypothetical protein
MELAWILGMKVQGIRYNGKEVEMMAVDQWIGDADTRDKKGNLTLVI